MLVRIGVLALAGLLGLLGSMLVARTSPAAPGLSDPSATTTAASTSVGTTSAASTAVSTSTLPTPPPPPVGVPLTRGLAGACVRAGGVMLLQPHRPPVVLSPVADPRHPRSATGAFVYPANGAVVRTGGVDVRAGTCRSVSRVNARSMVTSPSLFGGALTATATALTLRRGQPQPVVEQPRIGEKPVVLAPGARVRIAGWGYAVKGERRPLNSRRKPEAALTVHLLKAHAGL